MLDLIARNLDIGDLYINLAKHHLAEEEWGMALKAAEKGLSKGRLSDTAEAFALLKDIHYRLGIPFQSNKLSELQERT